MRLFQFSISAVQHPRQHDRSHRRLRHDRNRDASRDAGLSFAYHDRAFGGVPLPRHDEGEWIAVRAWCGLVWQTEMGEDERRGLQD